MSILKTHLIDQSLAAPELPKPDEHLRILHTSDWHLGKMLYHQSRYDEFAKFLDWLQGALKIYQVDVLIVAGDIFDTMTPSNRAEHLYHQFLATAFKNDIKHIIIVAGNHDSPTSLHKTKEVLGVLNTHVIGSISDQIADELITLTDDAGIPCAIIMAVPYLRDRDVRTSIDATSIDNKNQLLIDGMFDHYHCLADLAKNQQNHIYKTHQKTIPIIATGHLYAAGAAVSSADDGMRDIQIGTLGQISSEVFDEAIDYVALGHIHAAQIVGKQSRIRYSGSPIAMGFGEIGRHKQVLIVDLPYDKSPKQSIDQPDLMQFFDGADSSAVRIHSLPVPIFQSLAKISGDMAFIESSINDLKAHDQPIWLEIEYTGDSLMPNLKQQINALTKDSQLLALSIKNTQTHAGSLRAKSMDITLDKLNEMQVFKKRLAKENLPDDEQEQLIQAYQALIKQMQETDNNAQ